MSRAISGQARGAEPASGTQGSLEPSKQEKALSKICRTASGKNPPFLPARPPGPCLVTQLCLRSLCPRPPWVSSKGAGRGRREGSYFKRTPPSILSPPNHPTRVSLSGTFSCPPTSTHELGHHLAPHGVPLPPQVSPGVRDSFPLTQVASYDHGSATSFQTAGREDI